MPPTLNLILDVLLGVERDETDVAQDSALSFCATTVRVVTFVPGVNAEESY
jgi:hypothetical protein